MRFSEDPTGRKATASIHHEQISAAYLCERMDQWTIRLRLHLPSGNLVGIRERSTNVGQCQRENGTRRMYQVAKG